MGQREYADKATIRNDTKKYHPHSIRVTQVVKFSKAVLMGMKINIYI